VYLVIFEIDWEKILDIPNATEKIMDTQLLQTVNLPLAK
jgi:hypothetical protein